MLSALFLLLAMALAGGYGPLTAQPSPDPTNSQSSSSGTGSHRTAPVVAKQHFVLSETRDSKAAPWDDGKAKVFLAAKGYELTLPAAGVAQAPRKLANVATATASPFDARAPPAYS